MYMYIESVNEYKKVLQLPLGTAIQLVAYNGKTILVK